SALDVAGAREHGEARIAQEARVGVGQGAAPERAAPRAALHPGMEAVGAEPRVGGRSHRASLQSSSMPRLRESLARLGRLLALAERALVDLAGEPLEARAFEGQRAFRLVVRRA